MQRSNQLPPVRLQKSSDNATTIADRAKQIQNFQELPLLSGAWNISSRNRFCKELHSHRPALHSEQKPPKETRDHKCPFDKMDDGFPW